MQQQSLKEQVAAAALEEIEENIVLGVGSGSTVSCFVTALGRSGMRFRDLVSSSQETTRALQAAGYRVGDLNASDPVAVYVDGCDEIDARKCMIKGGGAALTREKIISAAADKFLCIADISKKVAVLGKFPLPVEVIPMARSYVARELVKLGGEPCWRQGIVTDNGNWILDVHYLSIGDPLALEQTINNIAGVVTVGIFAKERADVVLMSHADGTIERW